MRSRWQPLLTRKLDSQQLERSLAEVRRTARIPCSLAAANNAVSPAISIKMNRMEKILAQNRSAYEIQSGKHENCQNDCPESLLIQPILYYHAYGRSSQRRKDKGN